jgi:hypothetical protein
MAIRRGNWKLVRASRGLKEFEDMSKQAMLFNLAEDPGEQHGLAHKFPGKVRELQELWDRWNSQLKAPRWPSTLAGKPVRSCSKSEQQSLLDSGGISHPLNGNLVEQTFSSNYYSFYIHRRKTRQSSSRIGDGKLATLKCYPDFHCPGTAGTRSGFIHS